MPHIHHIRFRSNSLEESHSLLKPVGNRNRVIIDVNPYANCLGFSHQVIEPSIRDRIPDQLLENGLSEGDWIRCMNNFDRLVREYQISECGQILSIMFVVTIPFLFFKLSRLNSAIEEYLAEFNTKVLEPKGMYIKFQRLNLQNIGHHHKHRHKVRKPIFRSQKYFWLSIALNPEESLILKNESAVFDNDSYKKN